MKRKLVTIMMTIALATTLIACNDSNAEPIINSEFGIRNSELETEIDSELETEESVEAESKETETNSDSETETEVETEESKETESKEAETEETESKEDTTKKEENTTSSKKEDTSKNEDTSKKNEVKNDTSKKEDTSSKTEKNNTNTSKNDTSKKEEVKKEEPIQKEEPKNEEIKKEEPKQEETPSKKEESNTNTSNNNNSNTEASNNTPAPEPACTHPQTYIESGMYLRTESLGGGCVRDIEAAEDICLTCGAVVRSYERVGQEGHANMKRISGDSKAPTCTEDGYDYTTTTCDCGGYVNTNNSTYPATGHYYTTWCTGEVSEDGMTAKWVTACSCGDVANEWWE